MPTILLFSFSVRCVAHCSLLLGNRDLAVLTFAVNVWLHLFSLNVVYRLTYMVNAYTHHQVRVQTLSKLNKYLSDQYFECTAKVGTAKFMLPVVAIDSVAMKNERTN